MARAALLMVGSLDEDTVDFVPNYDDQLLQPEVLPTAYPNLLVNGVTGIAVGMATNMAPHNLVEVISAARYLLDHPKCSLDDLMKHVPGPDLPCGGRIVGLDGIRDAYLTGRGSFKTRATARIEKVTPRKMGIVVTELPYLVGPEKVIDKTRDAVLAKNLQGISDVKDLTDRKNGMRIVFEVKNSFHPAGGPRTALQAHPDGGELRHQRVALVGGEPKTMGLKNCSVFLDFRIDVVRRRTTHRLDKKEARSAPRRGTAHRDPRHRRGHPTHPLLRRRRDRPPTADGRLRPQRTAGLLHPRPATAPPDEVLPDRTRVREVRPGREIEALRAILEDEKLLKKTVSTEPRRGRQGPRHPDAPSCSSPRPSRPAPRAPPRMEVADDPCWVLLSSSGLLARTTTDEELPTGGGRAARRDRRDGAHHRQG